MTKRMKYALALGSVFGAFLSGTLARLLLANVASLILQERDLTTMSALAIPIMSTGGIVALVLTLVLLWLAFHLLATALPSDRG